MELYYIIKVSKDRLAEAIIYSKVFGIFGYFTSKIYGSESNLNFTFKKYARGLIYYAT